MANLPTYAQIGIAATWIMTGCRIVQGLSSMGEIIGSEIYVTEITKPPVQYPATAFISVASAVGAMAALGIAALVTKTGLEWRVAFWMGAGIAVVGSIARTRLRETPEFLAEKAKKKQSNDKTKEEILKKTIIAYFLIYCGWPISFYLSYIYFNPTLKDLFGYSSEDIILHNFFLSIVSVIASAVWAVMSYKRHPLQILKVRGIICLLFSLFLPIFIILCTNPFQIAILQSILLTFSLTGIPAAAVLIKHFPVLKRFTATSFLYAATRALMYIITSFGLVYLTESFGHYGLLLIMIPVSIGFLYGVQHFEKLEKGHEFVESPNKLKHAAVGSPIS